VLASMIISAAISMNSPSQTVSNPGLFDKGTFKIGLHDPFAFDIGTYRLDGEKMSNWNDLSFNTSLDYFFLNGFGAGIKIDYDHEYEKEVDGDSEKLSQIVFCTGLIYGTRLGKVNLYLNPYIGFGHQAHKFNYGGGSPEYEDKIFRIGIQLVSPIPLDRENRITLNPKLAWRYTKTTSTEYSKTYDIDSKFYVGAGLSMFFRRDELMCDRKTGFENSGDRFAKGRNIFEASSRFRLSHHTYKFHWEGGGAPSDDKDTETGADLKMSYKRAMHDGFLIGARLSFDARFYDYLDEETYTEKGIGFSIGPVAEYHPFGSRILRNLFLESFVGISYAKTAYENPFGIEKYKYLDFIYDLNAGFDYGMSGHLSVIPRLGIESTINLLQKIEEKDIATNGYFSIGLRFSY